MRKCLFGVLSVILAGLFVFSASCGSSIGSSGSSPSDNYGFSYDGNNAKNAQFSVYQDGVHVVNYSETERYVVRDSASDYKIVVARQEDGSIKLAREELIAFFEEATGIVLPVVYDDALPFNSNEKVICLGKNAYYDAALSTDSDLSTEGKGLQNEGFMIETVGNGIYIFGDYSVSAIFGVYKYLNIEFNYDCYSNTAYYIATGVKNVSLKNFSVRDVPDYRFRACYYSHITNAYPTIYRMGFGNGNHYVLGHASAHTSLLYLPQSATDTVNVLGKNNYEADHPNWYNGKHGKGKAQLCYTAHGNTVEYNAMLNEMFEIMKAYMMQSDGYLFRLGHSDGKDWCGCSACTEAARKYGANSGAVVKFANDLADKIDEWLATAEGAPYARDYRISVLAYGVTLVPPKGIRCHDRVIPYFAPIEMNYNYSIYDNKNRDIYQYFCDWMAISKEMNFYTYSTNYYYMLIPTAFFDQLQGFYQLGAKSGGYYINDLGQNLQSFGCTGWHILKSYLISKLSWDVNADLAELTENFFTGYFGDAAVAMKAFYDSYRVHAKYTVDNVYSTGMSVYMPLLDTRYWPKNVLDMWLDYIDEALNEIEYLKRIDINAYNAYYDRIVMERVSLYYMAISLYPDSYDQNVIQKMKLSFKEDCSRLGIVRVSEVNPGTIDVILQEWGM